jgi:cytoskeletal protein CcmA (bactofilin family)
MERDRNVQVDAAVSANQLELAGTSPETNAQFEAWLDKLRPSQPINLPRSQANPVEHPPADFVVECEEGTDCRISFEGVLHLDGLLTGAIHSEGGTLVAGLGIIEGDISVGAAFIEGSVTGNIRATERVILHPGAKVWGDVTSPALSVRPGALFQGDCILHEGIARRLVAPNGERAGEFSDQMQGLGGSLRTRATSG